MENTLGTDAFFSKLKTAYESNNMEMIYEILWLEPELKKIVDKCARATYITKSPSISLEDISSSALLRFFQRNSIASFITTNDFQNDVGTPELRYSKRISWFNRTMRNSCIDFLRKNNLWKRKDDKPLIIPVSLNAYIGDDDKNELIDSLSDSSIDIEKSAISESEVVNAYIELFRLSVRDPITLLITSLSILEEGILGTKRAKHIDNYNNKTVRKLLSRLRELVLKVDLPLNIVKPLADRLSDKLDDIVSINIKNLPTNVKRAKDRIKKMFFNGGY